VDPNDQGDIQASLAGNEQAFARLIGRYEQQVADLMWRFTRDSRQLGELVQDVFVEVYFSLPKYRGDAPLPHWIRKIATRVGYRFWKARDRQRQVLPLRDYDRPVQAGDSTDPSRAAEALDGLLAQLAPAERLVLTLQYFEELSVAEIARRMGWTQAMVKMRAHRARKKLKRIALRDKTIEDLRWNP
jgi:RNA polymerase sigma-70 factor (ECF subfamily)